MGTTTRRLRNEDVDIEILAGDDTVIGGRFRCLEWEFNDDGDVTEDEYTGEEEPELEEVGKGYSGKFSFHIERPVGDKLFQWLKLRRKGTNQEDASIIFQFPFRNGEYEAMMPTRVYFRGPKMSASGHELVKLDVEWRAKGCLFGEEAVSFSSL